MRRIFLTVALAVALSGGLSVTAYADGGELLGTLGGAALGGFVGSQFGSGTGRLAATGAGVFTGGLIGNALGSSYDRSRYYGSYSGLRYTGPTYYAPTNYYEQNYVAPPAPPPPQIVYTQPTLVEYRTREPAVVEGAYLDAEPGIDGGPSRYCREYTQQIRIGNEIKESYGTACLQPDGTWRIER